MDFSTHLDHLRTEGLALAAVCAGGSGDEPVPYCPGWVVDDLLRHTGAVHQWAVAALVGGGQRPARDFLEREEAAAPTDHAALVEWYAQAHDQLVRTLDKTDPESTESPCWTFLSTPAGPAFWVRRQAHETTMHRYDAESALGALTGIDTRLAHDGVEEVLGFIAERGRALVADPPVHLEVHAVDTGGRWGMEIGPDSRVVRPVEHPDATLSGLAADLYLCLWNRLDVVEPQGDPAVVELWHRHARIQ